MLKGFKIRIYPTKEQEKKIFEHINACRYIWNYMLECDINRYKAGEKHYSGFDMIKELTKLKKEKSWLNNVSSTSLNLMCILLGNAFSSFFKKKSGFPKFKSKKRSINKYPVRSDLGAFYFDEYFAHIQKIGKIKYKTDYVLPTGRNKKFYNVHISYKNGIYMLSFSMECDNQAVCASDKIIGIDLGIKNFVTIACDNECYVFENINKSKKVIELNKQIIHVQRSISRKYEAAKEKTGKYIMSKNIAREKRKLEKLYAKITNIRHEYIHKITSTIVSLKPKRVTMECLDVVNMLKNKTLSRYIFEQCFHEFVRQMKYKCEWNGIEFVQASQYFPSSKMCSHCGVINKKLKLSDRTFICKDCGLIIDRDYNAAINLMRYADLHTQAAV